jgi:two-component sensor histidine kinase/PAS domain-containing protein
MCATSYKNESTSAMVNLPKVARNWLLLTAGLVVGSGLLLALALTHLYNLTHEASHQSTAAVARIVQEQTDRTLQNVDQHLQLAAARLEQLRRARGLTEQSAQDVLREQVNELPFVRAMWVMDAKGVIVYDSDNGNLGVNLADRAYFQTHLRQQTTGFYIGAPVKNRKDIWVMSASRAIYGADRAFAGIVVAALSPSYFEQLWDELDLGAGGSVGLFRRDAVLLMRSPFVDAVIGKPFPELPVFDLLPQNKPAGTFQAPSAFDQVERDYAYRTLTHFPAVVVVGKAHAVAFLAWKRMAALSATVWCAASAFVGFLLFLMVRDLIKRDAVEQVLRQNKTKLRAMLDALPDLMFEMGVDGRYYDYHSPRVDLLAAPPDQLLAKSVGDLLPPEAAITTLAAIREAQLTGYSRGYEIELDLSQGTRWFELSAARKEVLPGEDQRCIVLSRDITERKANELALQASLNDKVGLLNEVHHRVKNNLQVITSLLRLEANRSAHAGTKAVLADMQGRIRSMALLHESLYRTGTFASVELGAYLKQLCTQAFRASALQNDGVQLVLDLGAVQVSLDLATPCGLLVNELVSNCLKHGFPGGRTGEVRVALAPVVAAPEAVDAHQWALSVRDNGVGLSADFETQRTTSLGLQLVSDLALQLGGTLEVGPGPGAAFTVVFTSQIGL